MARIVIVEKERLTRELLADYLDRQTHHDLVSRCRNLELALSETARTLPDIILMNTNIADAPGDAVSALLEKHPSAVMIVYSWLRYDILLDKLKQQGVKGFISTDDKPSEFTGAIESTLQGELYMSRTVAQQLALSASPAGDETLPVRLSDREKETLILRCTGRSVQEIAGILCLSPKTVFSHRKKLLEKTGAENLVELVFWSLRHRLLEVS
ncbi:MAG: response regulator transcription factor [Gammaproteobacteria bacterium]|jgi:two-component system, NarL family, invasion response regulator UvrY